MSRNKFIAREFIIIGIFSLVMAALNVILGITLEIKFLVLLGVSIPTCGLGAIILTCCDEIKRES